ncbi:MAG: ACP S-malonyltransferase [Candidatus Riflebacteria bacterium]|nr:ACP S-malonyltransferase [Candidatus Riflebacteria bacterium]
MGTLKVGFVFPGQGSQVVGMGLELAQQYAEARQVFETADAVLGGSFSALCWKGPEAELQQTANTQPAIVTASVACLRVFERCGVHAELVAGHSVGEYAALVAGGALSLDAAVGLTRLRGQLMESSCPGGTGSMAAVMGLDEETVRGICREVAGAGVAEVAGLNCPGQVVLAGHVQALSEALAVAKSRGASQATMLRVSGPFHSSLMAPAAEGLARELGKAPLGRPRVPVVCNADAQGHVEPVRLRENLVAQLTRPVLWQKSIELMLGQGVNVFVEFGAGRVLSGLMRRIRRDAQMLNVADRGSLDKTLGFFRAEGLAKAAAI